MIKRLLLSRFDLDSGFGIILPIKFSDASNNPSFLSFCIRNIFWYPYDFKREESKNYYCLETRRKKRETESLLHEETD